VKRPRLLFLSQTLPFPPDSGVKIRTYHTLRILSREYDVKGLCYYRRRHTDGDQGVRDALAALDGFGDFEAFPIPQEWSRTRWVTDHLASVVRRRPYTDFVFGSGPFGARVRSELATGEFDVVHLESLSLGAYLELVRNERTVCVHHNVESQLLERRADVQSNPLSGAYLRYQARRVRDVERRLCPRVDLNIAVSTDDATSFRAIAPDADFRVVPNGVDTEAFTPVDAPGEGIALLGGTDWFPNLDGLRHFCEDILPHVRGRLPDVKVVSVGRAQPGEIEHFRDAYGVELTGYVDDIRPWIQAARCVAVPLRVGGGSRLKILDSWALGKPLVTTSVGCEGLRARDGENALIRDEPVAFAQQLLAVLDSEDLRRQLSLGARTEAVTRYSWDVIGEELLAAYREVRPAGT
jgi:glycosyltransferase involved in cell wall biosynthesis